MPGHETSLTVRCSSTRHEKAITHLPLGGVHIDVQVTGRHLDGKVDERVGVVGQDGRVDALDGLLDGRGLHLLRQTQDHHMDAAGLSATYSAGTRTALCDPPACC